MKNKTILLLLTLGLMALVIGITACGRASITGDGVRIIPHDEGWGFTNCLVCHTDGEIATDTDLAFHQMNPTNEDCLIPGCHAEGITIIGDGKYPTTHELTGFFEDCQLCHYSDPVNPLAMPDDASHQLGNESCALPACHPPAGPTPTPTTTPTTTTTTTTTTTPTTTTTTTTTTTPTTTPTTTTATTTTTTTPTTTTTTTPTTTTATTTTTTTPAEPPVISIEWHPGVSDTSLCFICHVGEEGQVVDPWPASHVEEGHANDSCLNDGCHVFEQ